jgi:hypothetical protein
MRIRQLFHIRVVFWECGSARCWCPVRSGPVRRPTARGGAAADGAGRRGPACRPTVRGCGRRRGAAAADGAGRGRRCGAAAAAEADGTTGSHRTETASAWESGARAPPTRRSAPRDPALSTRGSAQHPRVRSAPAGPLSTRGSAQHPRACCRSFPVPGCRTVPGDPASHPPWSPVTTSVPHSCRNSDMNVTFMSLREAARAGETASGGTGGTACPAPGVLPEGT